MQPCGPAAAFDSALFGALFRILAWIEVCGGLVRRERLQHVVNGMVETFRVLPRRSSNAVGRNAAPYQMPGVAVVHVQTEPSNLIAHSARGGGVPGISGPSPPVISESWVVERLIKLPILYSSHGCELKVAIGRD